MDEEHVWVGSTIQTNGKQIGSYKERFQSICKQSSVNKKNEDGPHGTHSLPIRQMEQPGVH